MPTFATSLINSKVALLVPGEPEYLLGSYAKDTAPTRMAVTSVAVATSVATIGITVLEGPIPTVGNLISVAATTTDSGAANVASAALTGVTISAATGSGTVSYAVTGSNQLTTPDSGYAFVPTPEVAEPLVALSTVAAALPSNIMGAENAVTIHCRAAFPVTTGCSASVTLQEADYYLDSAFVDVGTVATLATGTLTLGTLSYTLQRAKFVRFKVAVTVAGTNPTAVLSVLI